MSDVVNLKQFKKQKARKSREDIAQQNRVTFGRTLAQKQFDKVQSDKTSRFLDQNRLEKTNPDDKKS
ncbi:DUF4169 family protein [Paenochrobactrum sp. BZR 588]|uniref:DUF4169 family protein n=1 Tax=Paenochrobactrum TaxID=999488 RepID=UPI0035BC6B3A